jgi:hypothetical protein
MKHNLVEQVGVYRRSNPKSRHPLIPIGTTFGSLSVLENDWFKNYNGESKRACRLRCKCGEDVICSYNHLRVGKSTSCGCGLVPKLTALQKERNPLIPVGKRIGRRTVIENDLYMSFGAQTKRACRVRCQCGKETIVPAAALRGDKSPSCGCRSRERSIDRVWNDLYNAHKRRGREFHLTLPQLKVISQMNCVYCDREPSNVYRAKYKVDGKYQIGVYPEMEIRWSGLDRVDSKKDYLIGNVVPCCWACNRIKSAMPLDDFLSFVERIHAHHPTSEQVLHQAASIFGE